MFHTWAGQGRTHYLDGGKPARDSFLVRRIGGFIHTDSKSLVLTERAGNPKFWFWLVSREQFSPKLEKQTDGPAREAEVRQAREKGENQSTQVRAE